MKRLTLCCLLLGTSTSLAAEPVDFNRDIRPLLSNNCYACHGPDETNREGGFRLDVKDSVLGEADSGERPLVPGDPDTSELFVRLTSDEDDLRMPPAESNKSLTPEQIELIRAWIEQGAEWREHWAFVPLERPPLPDVKNRAWPRTPVDYFILARLEREGLAPMPEADKVTLIRRVTLDLTGLPPTPAEVDAFLADNAPDAYERVVKRLLKSPHYGEHMARYWLDVARYGDTHGLHLDNYREIWPYRDWVIRAFNANMPYDQFTLEQLAGDLMPDPTLDQLVATGFNRCHVTTSEGGSIQEEVYVRNVVDRVVTTGTVFMGMTFECTRCHDHKYDPFTMKDFYSMFAFFNNLDGNPLDGNKAQHPPTIKVPTREQTETIDGLQQQIASIQKSIADQVALVAYDDAADADQPEQPQREEYVWIEDAIPAGATSSVDGQANGPWTFVSAPSPVYSGSKSSQRTAQGLSQHFFDKAPQGLRVGKDDKLFAYVHLDPENPPKEIMLQWHTDGWKHRAYWGENLIDWGRDATPERRHMGPLPAVGEWVRLEVEAAQVGLKPGIVITGWAFTQYDGTVHWDKAGIVTQTPQSDQPFHTLSAWVRAQRGTGGAGLPGGLPQIIKLDRAKRNPEQAKQLRDYFIQHAYAPARETFAPLHKQLAAAEKQAANVEKQVPSSLVFRERKDPRPSFLLNRGEYDQQRDEVQRNTPLSLPPMPEGSAA